MNIKYIIGSTFLSLLALLSCNDEERNIETKGYLELGVTKNVEVITRGFEVDEQSLAVDICVGANDSVVESFDDYNSMAGERVLLDVGTYKVKVSSNPIQKLDFEMPTFYGEKNNVSVTAGKTTPVSIECFLSCVKVTTEFTKPVQDKFASYVARISDKSGAYLDYDKDEERAGYFQPDYIMVDLTVENKEGLTFKMSKLIENTEARDHYHLIFDLVESGNNNSGMDFDISIETDPTNDEKHDVTIPLPETGYGQDAPEVQFVDAQNNPIATEIPFYKGEETPTVKAKVASTNIGLESVSLITTSSLFEEKELPATINLLDLSDELRSQLFEIGLDIPVLKDNKQLFEIDFSTVITQLPAGTHTFMIVARDEMGHEAQPQKVSVTVRLTMGTDDATDIWAHYVTLNGHVQGAAQEDINKYKFQYREKDTETWQDVSGNVTIASNGSISQVLTHLSASTTYEYQLVAEGNAADIKSFTTDEAAALPYGDFEDDANGPWNITDGGKNPNSYWSSGNNNFVEDLASKTNDNNGQVALLKSQKTIKFAAGNAFTGTFEMNMLKMAGTVTLGKPFIARPSRLKGEYKYTPKTVDNGGDKISNGSMDQCAIYIVLLTEPIALNTADTKTLDWKSYYKDKIIAVAELYRDNATTGYEDFDLKLDYWKTDETPSYIGVLCTSSRYGDYFQGADGSELCIDNFELVYDNEPNAE